MKKNVASQSIGAELITAADGTAFTGTATVLITKDNGTQSASAGTAPAHEGNGYHSYSPTHAETYADHIAFTWTGTGAIPATVQLYTNFPQTVDNDTKISLIPTTAMRGTDGANTVVPPSVAQFNARTLVSSDYFDPAVDAVANVTLVATTTTNTDMRGTDSANTVVPPSVAQFDARTLLAANYFDPATDAVANVTLVATTTTNTDMVGTNNALLAASYTAPDNAGITANGVAISNLNDISVASIFAGGDMDGFTLDESLKLILASQTGKASGMATTTATIRAADDSKTRITAVVDADGNRTSVTLDASG